MCHFRCFDCDEFYRTTRILSDLSNRTELEIIEIKVKNNGYLDNDTFEFDRFLFRYQLLNNKYILRQRRQRQLPKSIDKFELN